MIRIGLTLRSHLTCLVAPLVFVLMNGLAVETAETNGELGATPCAVHALRNIQSCFAELERLNVCALLDQSKSAHGFGELEQALMLSGLRTEYHRVDEFFVPDPDVAYVIHLPRHYVVVSQEVDGVRTLLDNDRPPVNLGARWSDGFRGRICLEVTP